MPPPPHYANPTDILLPPEARRHAVRVTQPNRPDSERRTIEMCNVATAAATAAKNAKINAEIQAVSARQQPVSAQQPRGHAAAAHPTSDNGHDSSSEDSVDESVEPPVEDRKPSPRLTIADIEAKEILSSFLAAARRERGRKKTATTSASQLRVLCSRE